ncbi:UvrD-helicase domain-containing protein [Mycoplasmatota bacterium]|nr:UvrD-helicase domain-containing protein [Mycoplasmatota bacterium]
MNQILENLNPQQLEAVNHYEGPMLVMAGAGSGKTKVLTHRIANLIEEKKISETSILAITFTNKAAKEMKERVISLVGKKAKNMHISTFHALCVYILRQDIDVLGYRHNFVIYDSNDTNSAIKKVLSDLNIDSKHYPPKRIANTISNAKNECVFPEQFKKYVKDDYTEIVNRVYKKYQEALMQANALDFDDLIMLTLRLFERDKEILNFYQHKFQFILVDEYQDTNLSQFKIVKLLAQRHHNIFAVGDSDQSIYSWRGADIRNILEFEKDFNNSNVQVKTIYLEQNYRSYQNILDCANCVIKNNYSSGKFVKKLWSNKQDLNKQVVYYRAVSSDVETEYIAQKITEKLKQDHYQLNDIAILYRTNAMSLALEKVLNRYKIDYEIIGNVSFFDRKEIKNLGAYLRLIVNTNDDISFLRVVNEPRRGIGNSTLESLKRYSFEEGISLFDAAKEINTLSNRAKTSLLGFVEMIEFLQSQLVDIDINDFIDLVLDKSNYLHTLKLENTEEANSRIENLEEFKTLTLDVEEDLNEQGLFLNQTLTAYDKLCLILNNIALSSGKKQKKENAVKMMTIHAAKGLEFPLVFIYGVEDNIFPLGGYDVSKEELEEERRLMYVAITRAKDELFITNSEMRKMYGNYKVNPESRFIREIDNDLLSYQGVKKIKVMDRKKPSFSIKHQEKSFEKKKENVKEAKCGSKIIHSRFGEGVIVNVNKDICTIAFSASHGIKKLDINHPAITIIK